MMNIKAHAREENDGIDRITSLPNNVLAHILSFLSTRNAVQTCILSKGWINTWASVPDLKFDIKEFELPENIKYHEKYIQEKFVTKFELLVKNVLEKRGASHVNRFQLYMDSEVFWPCKVLPDYIGDVMKLEPRECSVKLRSWEKLNLDTNLIFNCASLIYVELCLSTVGRSFVDVELNSVNLPCLKTLKFNGVGMSDESLRKLLLGCPVLEELVLEYFHIGIIEICSNTLKKLVLGTYYSLMKLQISTPNLQYLDISKVRNVTENLMLNMPSLVDASIYIVGWHGRNKYVTRALNLIHSLSNVESLEIHLCFPRQKIWKKDISSFPVFRNLKCLKFVSSRFVAFELPLYFLHHSPKLQELTLTNSNKARVREFLDEETTLEEMRLVHREYLKTIRIVGFSNSNGLVDQLINKFLAHVKIIDDFVINDL